MKLGYRIAVAVFVALIGYGGLLLHDLYIKPYVLSDTVVVIKSKDVLPKYHVLTASNVALKKVAKESVPADVIKNLDDVIGKMLKQDVSDNQILTMHMVDIFEMPGPNESYFPIPKDAIYGINGSLRAYDRVDIYLYQPTKLNPFVSGDDSKESEDLSDAMIDELLVQSKLLVSNVVVSSVRTDDNNEVYDNEKGNVNDRRSSTGRISSLEIILRNNDGAILIKKLEEGFKLYIVRKE